MTRTSPDTEHGEASGYAAILRQLAQWVREAIDDDFDPLMKITLDDIDVEQLDEVAAFIERSCPTQTPSQTDATKARAALIEFFRNEGASLGFNGDVEGWTPEQTAIDAMRELIRIKLALDLPQSAEEVEPVRALLASPVPSREPHQLPCPVCGGEAIHAIDVLKRTIITPASNASEAVGGLVGRSREGSNAG